MASYFMPDPFILTLARSWAAFKFQADKHVNIRKIFLLTSEDT